MIFNPFWITLTELLVMPGTISTSPVSAPDIYIYGCVCVGFYVCSYRWMAKEVILSPASLKRHRSIQKTFLCPLWGENCTNSCARENLRDPTRRMKRVSQSGVRSRCDQSGAEKQSVWSREAVSPEQRSSQSGAGDQLVGSETPEYEVKTEQWRRWPDISGFLVAL